MAFTSLLSLNPTNPISSTFRNFSSSYPASLSPSHLLSSTFNRRELQPSSVASQSTSQFQPINVDYLEQEFSGHGVSFQTLEETCCVGKMRLNNGSTATFLLPSGLITSYKAKMWHGGTMELLQTSVGSSSSTSRGEEDGALIQGGVSLAFNFNSHGCETSWSPRTWAISDVRGDSGDSIEVELVSTGGAVEQMVEIRYTITMSDDMLSSELSVSNLNPSSPIMMKGSILSHLTVSTPEATSACGLEGSNFFPRPMFMSDFAIVPPPPPSQLGQKSGNLWGRRGRNQNVVAREEEEGMEGEESDSHKKLTEQMCRVYTNAPRNFTLIDRGRRNSVVIGREGFNEMYMYSPGSSHESYGMYSYICVGQSAMLNPLALAPGQVWRGCQHLHNPNL
ncbi:unnamed protein product [Linum trigynum]|uniref:Protein NDH-DEPENDENT CYCLIC ELECTRON FLOW 5 n=1 Tax=Linum trigynum TaxID=586398 RepID=A0AAV2CL63_9ROSI